MSELLFTILADEMADWKRTCKSESDIEPAAVTTVFTSLIRRLQSAGAIDTYEASLLNDKAEELNRCAV